MTTFREDANLGKKVPQMKTDDYNDKSVTTQKIADEAVTTKKIAKNAITSDKISDDVVEELKESAKIAEVSASVGEKTGTPTVSVTHSRNNENKTTINFSFDGLKGEQGIKGDKGDKGDIGEVGKVSVKVDGSTGTPSATATSSKGEDGKSNIVISFSGLKGEKGEKGDRGERGLQGVQGVQGIQGEQGIQGLKGDTGEKGERGLQGVQGVKGDQGIQGEKGDKGEKGDVGEIGNVSVSITNTVGTPSATASTTKRKDGYTDISLSFDNLKGEKGDTGSKGEQGLKGDTGEQGIQGVQGERGEKGETGEAAGFGEVTATVDDAIGTPSVSVSTSGDNTAKNITFVFSGLKGEKGDRGEQGLKGDTGEQGIQGAQGERGEKGETGDQGLQGEQGLRGLQGERGEKGDKGDKGDKMTLADLTEAEIAELQEPAIEAAKKAEIAAEGAEKVNVELSGSEITVTNRDGEAKSIDVIGPSEKVVVYVSSSVDGLSVSGLKINVYLNNGKTPQTYITDSDGVAKFEVDRGNYYEAVFPEFGNAQAISPIGFTSVLGSRDIRVEYKPYSADETEEATITIMKYDGSEGKAFAGASVTITVGSDAAQDYTADENGKVYVYVPYGRDYTVTVKDQDGYNVRYAKNTRTFTAKLPKRSIVFTMYQYKTGILIVDDSLNEYLIDEWLADDKSADDAVAIRVAEQQLLLNSGSFLFRVSDLKNLSAVKTKQWCTQNIQFDSITLNGNSVKDENYYRGETSTFLIRQEAEERSLSVPAFDYAWNEELVIGDQHLRGFIMSVGQEYIHIANRVEISEVLRKLFGDEVADAYLTFVTSKNRWTSTQGTATSAWNCSSQAFNGVKYNSNYVLPVFAC